MYTLPRFRTQWAITDNNTSLPGAEKVVHMWVHSEQDGYDKKPEGTNFQVEEVPWNAEYVSESTGEWIQEPFFQETEPEQFTFKRLKIRRPSRYSDVAYIWYKSLREGLDLDSLEFEVIKDTLLRGYNTKERLLSELTLLALEGIDPRIDKQKLIRWVWWIQDEVKIGYELI
jgi:hypothetical protein